MEHIYEYLIGGRKMGKRELPTFRELKVGDIIYKYVKMSSGEYMDRLKIHKVERQPKFDRIQFEFKNYMRDEIPFSDEMNSFYVDVDTQYSKRFFATTEDEMRSHIKNQDIIVKDHD